MANKITKFVKLIISPLDFKSWNIRKPAIPVKCYTFMLQAEGIFMQITVVAANKLKAQQRLELQYPRYIKSFLWVNTKNATAVLKHTGKKRFGAMLKKIIVAEPVHALEGSQVSF